MILKFSAFQQVVEENVIKLSAAVHELSC